MEIMYNRTGKERKELVTAIAEITGAEAVYKGVPSCNYEVDYFTIDKEGTLIFDDSADSEEVEQLLEKLLERDIKVKKLELVVKSEEDLKVDKHLYIEEFQKEDSTIISLKNMLLLI